MKSEVSSHVWENSGVGMQKNKGPTCIDCVCARVAAESLLGLSVSNIAVSACLYVIMNRFMYMRYAHNTAGLCLCPSVCVATELCYQRRPDHRSPLVRS